MLSPITLFAQAEVGNPNLAIGLSNLGTAGLFLALFILGRIYPKSTYDERKEDVVALQTIVKTQADRIDQLVATVQEQSRTIESFTAGAEITNKVLTEIRSLLEKVSSK